MTTGPIRVALVCTMNQLGGTTTHARHIYTHLQGQGVRLTLIFCSLQEKTVREYMIAGGCDPKDMVFIPNVKKKFFWPFVFELRNIFLREKYDIIHAFDVQSHVLAGLAALATRVKILCHCEGQFLASTVSLPKRTLYRAINLFLKDRFVRSLAVSQGLARELIEGGFRPPSKVEVLLLGIRPLYEGDPKDLAYPGFNSNTPVIGTLSRLSVEKGLDRFIRAAAEVLKEVPSARFVICGHGPDEAGLKALARELSIDTHVAIMSLPFTSDIKDVLKTYDIYVLPSLREGLPTTLLEAMSMGRPAIASDIDGVREVIDNGVDGIIVDTADTKAFARAMISLCRDTFKAIDMGHRGLEKVRSSFHVDREMHRLREIYGELCYGRR
jgi:glycosyltransferase involved in cell wall biosynthesis